MVWRISILPQQSRKLGLLWEEEFGDPRLKEGHLHSQSWHSVHDCQQPIFPPWGPEIPAGWFRPAPHCLEDRWQYRVLLTVQAKHVRPRLDKAILTTSPQQESVSMCDGPFAVFFYKAKHIILSVHLLLTLRYRGLRRNTVAAGWFMRLQMQSRRHSFYLVNKEHTEAIRGHRRNCQWLRTMPPTMGCSLDSRWGRHPTSSITSITSWWKRVNRRKQKIDFFFSCYRKLRLNQDISSPPVVSPSH